MKAQALQGFRTMMNARAEQVRALYAARPELAVTSTALLRLERRVHTAAGWDSQPHLFFLRQNQRNGHLSAVLFESLTAVLRELAIACGGNVPHALAQVAHVTEMTRAYYTARVTGIANPDLPVLPVEAEPLLARLVESVVIGGDPVDGGAGHRIHGVGFLSMGYLTGADDPEGLAAARAFQLASHPDRTLMRQIYYAGRDGWSYDVWRVQGTRDIEVPRYCFPTTPDDESAAIGAIPNAITRICNAMVGNLVPVRDKADVDDLGD